MCLICLLFVVSSQTYVWDHAFKSLQVTECILKMTTNLLSKVKIDGESRIKGIHNLYQFDEKCLSHEIFD